MNNLLTEYIIEDKILFYPIELSFKNIIPRKSINNHIKKIHSKDVYRNIKIPIKKIRNNKEFIAYYSCTLVSLNGLRCILIRSRNSIPQYMLDYYKICEYGKFQYEESKFISVIKQVFKNEIMLTQYMVNKYRLDGYFPKYNLIIEVDESDHKYYKFHKELKRYVCIKNILHNPVYIRIDTSKSDIFEILQKIYYHISLFHNH